MSRPFRRTRAGIRVQLDRGERSLLAHLLDDVDGLLAQDAAERGGARSGRDGGPADGREGGSGPDSGRDASRGSSGAPDDDPGAGWSGTGGSGTGGGSANETATGGSDADVLAALEASLTVPPPGDPAVARLLPAGHRDDDELAAGFRRMTEDGLRARKRAGLELASAALGRPEPVLLDGDEAAALLKGMTDVRLVLAERLGLRSDEDAERMHAVLLSTSDFDDPRVAAAALYDALTWWQESLVTTLR
jgi:hypothetical protein